jgi:hypothetical protein
LSIVKSFALVVWIALFAACSPRPSAGFVFPEEAGGWKLKTVKELPAADAPEQIRRLGLKRTQSAEYESAGRITAQVYELTSSAAAFETEQTWRPVADTVAFHNQSYFAVIHWENAERTAVSAFVKEMEKQLGR